MLHQLVVAITTAAGAFMVTLRLGRVVGPARRQLLAVCRRRCGLGSRLVPRAARARAAAAADLFNDDATCINAICDSGVATAGSGAKHRRSGRRRGRRGPLRIARATRHGGRGAAARPDA